MPRKRRAWLALARARTICWLVCDVRFCEWFNPDHWVLSDEQKNHLSRLYKKWFRFSFYYCLLNEASAAAAARAIVDVAIRCHQLSAWWFIALPCFSCAQAISYTTHTCRLTIDEKTLCWNMQIYVMTYSPKDAPLCQTISLSLSVSCSQCTQFANEISIDEQNHIFFRFFIVRVVINSPQDSYCARQFKFVHFHTKKKLSCERNWKNEYNVRFFHISFRFAFVCIVICWARTCCAFELGNHCTWNLFHFFFYSFCCGIRSCCIIPNKHQKAINRWWTELCSRMPTLNTTWLSKTESMSCL